MLWIQPDFPRKSRPQALRLRQRGSAKAEPSRQRVFLLRVGASIDAPTSEAGEVEAASVQRQAECYCGAEPRFTSRSFTRRFPARCLQQMSFRKIESNPVASANSIHLSAPHCFLRWRAAERLTWLLRY